MLGLVHQSCLTLCNPMDCSPPGCSVYGDSPGKYARMGCQAFLQGIFPTQGSNPGLPHLWWTLSLSQGQAVHWYHLVTYCKRHLQIFHIWIKLHLHVLKASKTLDQSAINLEARNMCLWQETNLWVLTEGIKVVSITHYQNSSKLGNNSTRSPPIEN